MSRCWKSVVPAFVAGWLMVGCCEKAPAPPPGEKPADAPAAPAEKPSAPSVGADVAAVFARAKEGRPLRYVALGGSITQSGKGWIGDWLKATFPESEVTAINSGMSATGSALGIFRVGRDVIAHQPDLVAIEYCVNDGGLSDEQAVRYMESLVVRLKQLPNPPAIVILEVASKYGVNLKRHRQVAQHYGLVEVDLQAATDAELKASGRTWDDLFKDNVHPNAAGDEVYARAIEAVLEPFVTAGAPPACCAAPALPAPISTKPLLLDGDMVRLSPVVCAPGWQPINSVNKWWDRFFAGYLGATEPGTSLELTFRGTTAGILYIMSEDYGTFQATIDGAFPQKVATNTRGGYSFCILDDNLPAREHRVTVALPVASDPAERLNGPVNLAYLLIAGTTHAVSEPSPQGPYTAAIMSAMKYEPVPAQGWQWTGPYLDKAAGEVHAVKDLPTPFAPEQDGASGIEWKPVGQFPFDFRQALGSDKPAVCYLRGTLTAPAAENIILGLSVDYFAKVWVNGKEVANLDGPHGSPKSPTPIRIQLKAGENSVLIKTAAGSEGHVINLSLMRNLPEGG